MEQQRAVTAHIYPIGRQTLLLPGRRSGGCLRFAPETGSVVFSPQTNCFTAQMERGRGRLLRGGDPGSFVLFHITDVPGVFNNRLTKLSQRRGNNPRSGSESSIYLGVKVTTCQHQRQHQWPRL